MLKLKIALSTDDCPQGFQNIEIRQIRQNFFKATTIWELTPPPQENRPLASDNNQKCYQTCTIV